MSRAMPSKDLRALWEKLEKDVGAFRGFDGTELQSKDGYRIAHVTCSFERQRIIIRVVFDRENKVAGLFFAPAKAPPVAWSAPPYATPNAFGEHDVTVGTAPSLPGTLTVPKGTGPFPAIVLVHGSGPNDRDETIGGVKPFKDLAWGLASKGVVVLRYVKRSKHSPTGIVTQKEEVLDGAHDAIELLRRTPAVDAKRVFLAGHSQGGYLAPRIAEANPALAGMVILAGSTIPLEDSIIDQLTYFASLEPKNADLHTKLEAAVAFKRLVASPDLRPEQELALPIGSAVVKGAYFLDVRGYEPAVLAARLSCKLLVLQGERDYQVTTKDFDGWKKALGTKKTATLKTYPSLNHLFVSGTGAPSPAEYRGPGHVDEQVVSDIARWINTPTTEE
jgi:dienelactone hydrolase